MPAPTPEAARQVSDAMVEAAAAALMTYQAERQRAVEQSELARPFTWTDAARAALTAALSQDGWQPIETAPRDGTPILGYRAGIPVKTRIAVIAWLPEEWRLGDSWSGSALGLTMQFPTHWRPLPAPPLPTQEEG
jgi:hypothetical protein